MRSASILAVITAVLLASATHSQERAAPTSNDQTDDSVKKVKELREERIATLEKVVAQLADLFRTTRATYDDVLDAQRLLIEARLEATETGEERVRLYESLVAVLKARETYAEGQAKAAREIVPNVLKAMARRLEAEIHLEQAKMKLAKPVSMRGEEHRKIVVRSPQAQTVTITRQYVSQIHSHRHINVRAFERGHLEAIPVREGQAVKEGDLMFKVVPTLYKAKLDAEMAEVQFAQLEYNFTQKAFADKVVSHNSVLLDEAKLAKAKAKAQLATAELDLATVKAPFDGIIDRFHHQQGSLVEAGEVLTTLSDNSVMWVYFDVPEKAYLEYMADLNQNTEEPKIELVLADGNKFQQTGKIGAIEADFRSDTGSIPFRADFPNPHRLLRHGQNGTLLISRVVKDAIVIPQRATFEVLNKRYVYVVDNDNVAHQREIIIQNESEDLFVIKQGIGVEDKIILDGFRQIREGDKVEYEDRQPE